MSLSSNSIIHFSKNKSHLEGILKDNFHISYCLESVNFGETPWRFHAPMVSFCDIPLSEIKNHIQNYGVYGIGLTKEWAARKGLNPVLYVQSNSFLSSSFMKSMREFVFAKGNKVSEFSPEVKAHLDILRYMKNYQGNLTRKGETIENYRFSDEREWRYVPSYESDCNMIVGTNIFKDVKKEVEEKVRPLRLEFEPNDIKYIIVSKDDEIEEFLDILGKAKRKYAYEDVKRLNTRIITTEQIMSDF